MKRRSHTQEFKAQAVALAREIGMTAAARQLGISDSSIHAWKAKLEGYNAPKTNALKMTEAELQEIKQLRKENAELKKVNYILKQAAAFFSQDHIKSVLK